MNLLQFAAPFLHRSFLTAQHLRDCDWAVAFKINMSIVIGQLQRFSFPEFGLTSKLL